MSEPPNVPCNTQGQRTVSDILWSCFSTIFLCTWVAIHVNVPEPVDMSNMSRRQRCFTIIYKFLSNRIPLFLWALLIPEYILALAIRQRLRAGNLAKMHARLALTRAHAFFIIMGGFHYFHSPSVDQGQSHQDIIWAIQHGQFRLPSKEEIKDKSKSDCFAKTIVLIQTLWFIVQCIARRVVGLPITELEIITLAYTAINVGIFIAWWDKPRNVDCPIPVFHRLPQVAEKPRPQDTLQLIGAVIIGVADQFVDLRHKKKVPRTFSGNPEPKCVIRADYITLALGMVFGAIHFIAWSFKFSSQIDSIIWISSSAIILGIPFLLILTYLWASRWDPAPLSPLSLIAILFIGIIYITTRFLTLVMAFKSLVSLPLGVFDTVNWTSLLPRV